MFNECSAVASSCCTSLVPRSTSGRHFILAGNKNGGRKWVWVRDYCCTSCSNCYTSMLMLSIRTSYSSARGKIGCKLLTQFVVSLHTVLTLMWYSVDEILIYCMPSVLQCMTIQPWLLRQPLQGILTLSKHFFLKNLKQLVLCPLAVLLTLPCAHALNCLGITSGH